MRLTAVFETWHLGDGNYPPLHVGQTVNLSFEMLPYALLEASSNDVSKFERLTDAEYRFVGKVLKTYGSGNEQIAVLQAEDFRFYINSFPEGARSMKEGDSVKGHGRLLLDHYVWVEFLSSYKEPPDLFYPLSVTRIRSVKIPQSFITRYEHGKAYPASLSHNEYSAADIQTLERMQDSKGDEAFFLVDFEGSYIRTAKIPLTFLGPSAPSL